ncbi:MFS transporter [Actinacidiphila epipremni]|uniref:MFS transporter n=1 Tax=Actinacidiphila epipremni TaxID=2053013 RepID=A0ABX0ZSQ4_9ACTN|nr:MFS transporter [Actinacidiphila epipremni]NJP44653.1 MFS transporter [Actinacidiphila epipremni]
MSPGSTSPAPDEPAAAKSAGVPAEGTVAHARADAVVVVLAFAGIVVSLMQTLVIPLVPELPDLLHASASDATWAVTATLLASAVATPVFGRLGDMYGKRRLLLLSLALLTAGSVVCALSDTLAPMVVGRALQGVSAGVIPLGISIMRDELPVEKLASATAVMSASLGVGGALGLPAAALLADHFDWHMLFWVSAAAGVVATGLVLALVPESRVRSGGRFDVAGALGLSAALVCLLLAISKGAQWGWASGTTLGLFGAGAVILLAWGAFQLRVPYALVDLRVAARRQVLFTNLASVSFGFSMFALSLVMPQLLQLPTATGYGLGKSLLVSGLVLAPQGLVMMATAPLSARITRARGPKVTLMLGTVTVAAGYVVNIALMSQVWQLVLVSCIIGAGVGLGYGAMPALVMGAVPVSETAAANSLNSLMRAVGTSVSSAVAGVVLAQMTLTFGAARLPSQNGFRTVMAIGAGAALLALALASFIPARRAPAPSATPQGTPEPALTSGDAT